MAKNAEKEYNGHHEIVGDYHEIITGSRHNDKRSDSKYTLYNLNELLQELKQWIEMIDVSFKPRELITSETIPKEVKDIKEDHLRVFRDYSILHHSKSYLKYVKGQMCTYLNRFGDRPAIC